MNHQTNTPSDTKALSHSETNASSSTDSLNYQHVSPPSPSFEGARSNPSDDSDDDTDADGGEDALSRTVVLSPSQPVPSSHQLRQAKHRGPPVNSIDGVSRRSRRNHSATLATTDDSEGDDGDSRNQPSWIDALPAEALVRILGLLDPQSLARSALVCRRWASAVRDDATWRLAFFNAFIRPCHSDSWDYPAVSSPSLSVTGSAVTLRRTDLSSWKAEYRHRVDLSRRWRKSRSSAVSTDMRVSIIDAIAFAPRHKFMLSASVSYGIASRADPFRGKVGRGFLDAAGLLNGVGIGNPQTEFTPDVTALAINKDASRIVWAFRTGTIAITSMSRQGSNPRGLIRNTRFSPATAHTGAVNAVAFDLNQPGQKRRQHRRDALGDAAECFVTGGEDGSVRLWAPSRPMPLWVGTTASSPPEHCRASEEGRPDDPPAAAARHSASDAVCKVDFDADRGVVAAGTAKGSVHVWTGLDISALLAISPEAWDDQVPQEVQTPSQVQSRRSLATAFSRVQRTVLHAQDDHTAPTASGLRSNAVDHLIIDSISDSGFGLVVHRSSDAHLAYHWLIKPKADEQHGLLDIITATILLAATAYASPITAVRFDSAPFHHRDALPKRSTTEAFGLTSPQLRPMGDQARTTTASSPEAATPVLGPAPGAVRNLTSGLFSEKGFVCAGTKAGNLVAWKLPSLASAPRSGTSGQDEVRQPDFLLDCHHAEITAIDFSNHLLATGTVDGHVKAFDALTGQLIRTWTDRIATKHMARMLLEEDGAALTATERRRFRVQQIIIDDESILAAAGPWLLAWKPESALSGRRSEMRKASSTNSNASTPGRRSTGGAGSGMPPLSKYAQMRELKNELEESTAVLEAEKAQRQAAYQRLGYARGLADMGGLDESEALAYAIMLSKDEEEERKQRSDPGLDENTQLTALARIRKEDRELQRALETAAASEAEESLTSRHLSSSRSKASTSPYNDDGSDDGHGWSCRDDGMHGEPSDGEHSGNDGRASVSSSCKDSIGLPSPSTRAWDIIHKASVSQSPGSPTGYGSYISTSRSRWGDHDKVRTVSVPHSARLSPSCLSSRAESPALVAQMAQSSIHDDSALDCTGSSYDGLASPTHWPAVGSLDIRESVSPSSHAFTLGPSVLSADDSRSAVDSVADTTPPCAVKGKGKAPSGEDCATIARTAEGGHHDADVQEADHRQVKSPAIPRVQGAWASGRPQWKFTAESTPGTVFASHASHRRGPIDVDADLQYAIELSLAEERSRVDQ